MGCASSSGSALDGDVVGRLVGARYCNSSSALVGDNDALVCVVYLVITLRMELGNWRSRGPASLKRNRATKAQGQLHCVKTQH